MKEIMTELLADVEELRRLPTNPCGRPMPKEYFAFRMQQRRYRARFMGDIGKTAFEQGVGSHNEAKYPVWANPREVDLYATNAVQIGHVACAVVDEKGKKRPHTWVDSTLLLLDNPDADVFGGGTALAIASRGELYLGNYMTPTPDQVTFIDNLLKTIIQRLGLVMPVSDGS